MRMMTTGLIWRRMMEGMMIMIIRISKTMTMISNLMRKMIMEMEVLKWMMKIIMTTRIWTLKKTMIFKWMMMSKRNLQSRR
jgi:hypothetical protein